MKEAQRKTREPDPAGRVLYVRVQLYTWMPIFDKFLEHLDHKCFASDGQNINVRVAKRHRAS